MGIDESKLQDITAEHFLSELQAGPVSLEYLRVQEDVVGPKNHTMDAGSLQIENSIFSNVTMPSFSYKSLSFSNTAIEKLSLHDGQSGTLKFTNCRITEFNITGSYLIPQTIRLENCEVKHLSIATNKEVHQLELLNTKIDSVKVHSVVKHVTIISCKGLNHAFSSPQLSTSKDVIETIEVTDKTVELRINGNSQIRDIYLQPSIKVLAITSSEVYGRIHCRTVSGSLTLTDSFIAGIEITEPTKTIILSGGKIKAFLHHARNDHFAVTKGQSEKTDAQFETLDLSNSFVGDFQLESVRIDDLILNGFKADKSKIRFAVVKDSFHFQNSIMEEAFLHNINLTTAEVRFLNSSLAKSTLSNVEWPPRLYEFLAEIASKKSRREKIDTLSPLRDSYRQLKYLSNSQQNQIDAVLFQKRELRIYWRLVHAKNGWQDFGDWFLLGTNKIFSDFGQSWILPLIWLLFVHTALFSIVLLCFDIGIVPFANTDWTSTRIGIGMFFNLLSPFHSGEIPHAWKEGLKVSIFGTADFFIRFSAAYFIYYILKATRKFAITST